MRPNLDELDDEIKGHLALEIQQRIERGEDPEAARLAALRQFGYVPKLRDEMRRVWYSRWFDAAEALAQEIRVGLRSLLRAKGLAATVVVTLALGIGANAAIFSVVRGVLLRPLVNRGEERLVFLGQNGRTNTNVRFSVPEINDLRARMTTVEAIGEFSVINFTLVGLGEPRVVQAGVVNGSYFEVMGLRPVLGRLLDAQDEGLKAAGAAVVTHRFWTDSLNSDPSILGKTVNLGARTATIVGVLEPSVPYPADTELIANLVTSPHHMGAAMVTMRTHRMTDLFARMKPGVTIADVRAEVQMIHDGLKREHPDSYAASANLQVRVNHLRDQISAPARPILLLLLAAAGVVFIIACSNVANLILARSVRREGELAVRAALGASAGALRRTLLAESLVLCAAGAVLGVLLARPMVSVVSTYAARFSVRALEVTVDASLLWVGAAMAIAAAVLLAYVPKLPTAQAPTGSGLANGSIRLTPATSRRLRVFAMTQIAFSFVMLAGAAMLLAALVALQTSQTGFEMRQVLAIDLPNSSLGGTDPKEMELHGEMVRRISALPGVDGAALGSFVPWRDAQSQLAGASTFAIEGFTPENGEEPPRARLRMVAPGFFNVMDLSLSAGRDFTDDDRRGNELVVIVSQSIASRLFPNGDALNRKMWWTDPYFGAKPALRRIVGVVEDVDDLNVVRGPAMTVYHPIRQMGVAGRLFVHASGDPYLLVTPVTRIVRELAPNQPVERAATLEDVRAEVLGPQRINAFVFSGFAGVALLIAVVGVAGVLAFGVSARTREFGVRLAIGSTPQHLLMGVLREGVSIVAIGIAAGAIGGYAFAAIAVSYFGRLQLPGALPMAGAAAILIAAAVFASLMPAARASRIDVLRALRTE